MNKTFRKEKKYIIRKEESSYLNNYLSKVLEKDEHNKCDGYMVRSLYFDTLEEKDFYEKIDGIDQRKKIRLRVYDLDEEIAYLEIKQKQQDYQLKRIAKLEKNEAMELIKGNYGVLLTHKDELAQEIYVIMATSLYKPKAIVQYNRKAFGTKENNTRITIDSDIIATESNFNLFSKNLSMYPIFENSNSILEVKYEKFLLTYVKECLEKVEKSEVSASKYCMSRKITLNYTYI